MEKQFKKTYISAYYAARGPARPVSARLHQSKSKLPSLIKTAVIN